MAQTQDAIIIGGGHNGLTAAAYLARAGLRVTVLERREVVGGAAVTEEFHPGFRNSAASYTVSLLHPQVINDLELAKHGLKVVERKISNFLPLNDHEYLKVGGGKTKAEVAKFSARDAERLDAYGETLERMADVLRGLVLQAPPNLATGQGWLATLREGLGGAKLFKGLRALGLEGQRDLMTIMARSAGDYLDDWFESVPIKAAYGFDGIVGSYSSPYAPGSAYVLLHHCFGEVNGKRGVWGHAIGGMGAITQAMRKSAESKGALVRTGAPVAEILAKAGRVVGVVTESGERYEAPVVLSNLHPHLTFGKMMDPAALPADFKIRMERWKSGSGVFRMNVALSRLPSFTCLPGSEAAEHHTAGIIMAPSLAYMERAYEDARRYGWSKEPIVEMIIPSTLDDSLAPPGAHVASLFCQHVATELPGGRSWDDARDEVADLMIQTVDRYAPGFAQSVVGRQIHSPLDLERKFGLVGGDIFHGRLTLDQLFSARPTLGAADYRAPVKGLYMCGSSTHPGGGVTGAPGHNAARAVLKDLGRKGR